MTEIMSPHEFKHGLLRLADKDDPAIVSESVVARHLAAAYLDADDETRRDCSEMLRRDLALVGNRHDQ